MTLAAALLWTFGLAGPGLAGAEDLAPNLKVAFVGDMGAGPGARDVLGLIRNEAAGMVLHQGDFDYADDPDKFDQMISDILGPDFPYFASPGNHDVRAWPGYEAKLRARLDRIEGAECEGDLGTMAACSYKGLFFVLSGVGLEGTGSPERHAAFIEKKLAASSAPWKICSWHKNQQAMQVGEKKDETGWDVYEACRQQGAIIATAHNHGYARSYLMARFADTPKVASMDKVLEIRKGRTFAFVSGLGGHSIRPQKLAGGWWAAIYTATQDAAFGALFCTFNPGGRLDRARCYFKTVTGEVPDRFELVSKPRLASKPKK